jgi:aspartyl/glutamyl-tRNA(Asn/Gln) amidotransferase C subunit
MPGALHAAIRLARLPLTRNETADLAAELSAVRALLSGIRDVDTRDVPALGLPHRLAAAARDDSILPSLPQADALRNAPASTGGFVRVTKVL